MTGNGRHVKINQFAPSVQISAREIGHKSALRPPLRRWAHTEKAPLRSLLTGGEPSGISYMIQSVSFRIAEVLTVCHPEGLRLCEDHDTVPVVGVVNLGVAAGGFKHEARRVNTVVTYEDVSYSLGAAF